MADALLQKAAGLLTSSVDVPTTLRRLGTLLVPQFADWCTVFVREERQSGWRVVHAPHSGARERREVIQRAFSQWMRKRLSAQRELATGAPELVEEVTEAWLNAEIADAVSRAVLGEIRAVGVRSLMFLPLDLDGVRVGAILLLVLDPARARYGSDDLRTAERLAALAAATIRNAKLWETLTSELAHRRQRHEGLRQTVSTIGALCSGLGHDMGNVLQALRLRLDSLQSMELPAHATSDLRAVADVLGYLQRLAHSLRILANDARAESAEHSLTRLRAWANDVQSLIRYALPPSVELVSEIPQRLPPAQIPAVALTQVVFNLVHSAGEALASQRGGRIRLRAGRTPDREELQLLVEDNGPGLSAEAVQRLLDPHVALRERPETGMGLRLARALVQRAGGDIGVTSELGRGTTFVITLPVGEGRAKPRRRVTDVQIARVTVEDPKTRSLVTRALQREGYFVDQTDGTPHRQERVWVTDQASARTPDRLLQFVDRPDRIAVVLDADVPTRHPRIRSLDPRTGAVDRLSELLSNGTERAETD